jgi:hypothetical protein
LGECADAKIFLARHPRNEDADLTITSESGSEQVATEISFVSPPKRSPERTAITLHEELATPPTWRANCQMLRSGQPTGVLIPVVYLFGGEESEAKNSKVAHEYVEHREHGEFILVRASGE